MKGLISFFVSTFLSIAVTCGAVAQNKVGKLPSVKPDISAKQDSTAGESGQILMPVNDPHWNYQYTADEPARFVQSGLYIDRYGVGGEMTLNTPNRNIFGRLFAGAMLNPVEQSRQSNQTAWAAGLTVGYETLFHSAAAGSSGSADLLRTGMDGFQLYGRAGPGIGIMTVSKQSRGSSETHLGMHAEMTIGTRLKIFNQTAIYVETGVLGGYFPTFSEMNWIGTPQLKVGFVFLGNRGVVPYRF